MTNRALALQERERAQSVAGELLRALRGRRSKPAFSRYLGYRSNVAQRWEARVSWPTAPRFFEICERCRIDTRAAVSRFLRREPPWLARLGLTSDAGIAAFISDLQGQTPVTMLASQTGYNRFSISRWLKGQATPRLPELLCLIEASSRRLPDFVAEFVNPEALPTLARQWRQLSLAREGVFTRPWSHAVLRALDLPWRGSSEQQVSFLARRVGVSEEVVLSELEFLLATGQAKKTRRVYVAKQRGKVDTGGQAQRALALKLTWAKLGLERLGEGSPGHLGYSLFSVSRQDMLRIWQLQLDYVRALSTIIAESEPSECVGLYSALLLDLSAGDENVFRSHEVPAPTRTTT